MMIKIYEDFLDSLIKQDVNKEEELSQMSIIELWESGKDIGQISYIKKLQPSYQIIKKDLEELIGVNELEEYKQLMKKYHYSVEPRKMNFNTYANGPIIKSVVIQDIYLPGQNKGGASIADKIIFDDIVLRGWKILTQKHYPKTIIILEYEIFLLEKENSIIEVSVAEGDKVFGSITTVVKI